MPLRAAPGEKLGAAACAAGTKRKAQLVLQTRPCGAPAKWSLRLGRTCTQASPSAVTTGVILAYHPCPRRALANGHERSTTAHADRP
jgi:hypothetical protein